MAYKCGGIDITHEVLQRVSVAAREWSGNPALTPGQQALARTLDNEAARLAETAEPLRSDIAFVTKTCCHLLAAAHGGALPDRAYWPCTPRGGA